MKTSIWIAAAFSILMAGCGSSGETVVKTPDGTVTASKSGDTMTFKSDEGTATYTQNDAGAARRFTKARMEKSRPSKPPRRETTKCSRASFIRGLKT